MIRTAAFAAAFALAAATAQAADWATKEGDYTARDFHFTSGETLGELRLHYTTLGTPHRDAHGHVTNAVLILHGTGGDGHQFLRPIFADVLFAPGGLLDIQKYYIVLPDGIGHGKSSKPSDGLHAKFPHYGYTDMVAAQHDLLVHGLHVDHLRLVMGTSMGCMHSFVWAETFPRFIDAAMPLACEPTQIAGRNRMWRKMLIDAVQNDPAWMGGEYKTQPQMALRVATDMLVIAGSAPYQMQKAEPTRDAADKYLDDYTARELASLDANDILYQVAASHDYDPSADLGKIVVPVTWVNSADDFINPPELGIAEGLAAKNPRIRYVLIPQSDQTYGHGTHTRAAVWKDDLAALLKATER